MAPIRHPRHEGIVPLALSIAGGGTFAAIDAVEILRHSIDSVLRPFDGCRTTFLGLARCVIGFDAVTLAGVVYHIAVPIGIGIAIWIIVRHRFRRSAKQIPPQLGHAPRADTAPVPGHQLLGSPFNLVVNGNLIIRGDVNIARMLGTMKEESEAEGTGRTNGVQRNTSSIGPEAIDKGNARRALLLANDIVSAVEITSDPSMEVSGSE